MPAPLLSGEAVSAANTQRLKVVERMGVPDRVPLVLFIGAHYFTGATGVSMAKYVQDYKVMADVQERVREKYLKLFGLEPDYEDLAECQAMGCPISFEDENPATIRPAIRSAEDVHGLEVPDLGEVPLMQKSLAAYRYMAERYGAENVSFEFSMGPFDYACLVRGQSEFFTDLVFRPNVAHELLDVCTETLIKWAKVREEATGGRFAYIGLGDDFPGYVGPKRFAEFYIPYAKRFYSEFPHTIKYWHSDGDTSSVVGLIPQLGIDVFNNFTPDWDLSFFKERLGGKVALIGNIHPLKVLLKGTPESVKAECERLISVGAPGGGYALSSGGGIPRGTPEENVWAMIEAATGYRHGSEVD